MSADAMSCRCGHNWVSHGTADRHCTMCGQARCWTFRPPPTQAQRDIARHVVTSPGDWLDAGGTEQENLIEAVSWALADEWRRGMHYGWEEGVRQ